MTDESTSTTPLFATIGAVISSGGAVIAAACAIISTSHLLKSAEIDAQEKYFGRKFDACEDFAETENALATNPMIAASNDENRRKAILRANRLVMLFPDHVKDAGEKFVNNMDIVYAANRGGSEDTPLGMKAGSLVQAAIVLEEACQADISRSAQIP